MMGANTKYYSSHTSDARYKLAESECTLGGENVLVVMLLWLRISNTGIGFKL